MQLSEAMRLGAMIRPQTFGFFFSDGSSCALGAALEATGTDYGAWQQANADLRLRWSWITKRVHCPVCQDIELNPRARWFNRVIDRIAHLNNDHHWTREAIADWLATIEPKDDAPVETMTILRVLEPITV